MASTTLLTDLKPKNLYLGLFGSDAFVKIGDFLLSFHAPSEQEQSKRIDQERKFAQSFLDTGLKFGTPLFAAPEQLNDGFNDLIELFTRDITAPEKIERTKKIKQYYVFVLALLFLDMLGHHPRKRNSGEYMARMLIEVFSTEPAEKISGAMQHIEMLAQNKKTSLQPQIKQLRTALTQALSLEPENRHSSCLAFVRKLQQALQDFPNTDLRFSSNITSTPQTQTTKPHVSEQAAENTAILTQVVR